MRQKVIVNLISLAIVENLYFNLFVRKEVVVHAFNPSIQGSKGR